ncbi:MAG TPA: IS110 family transposase [Acetobacteraceae bacterium]|nr:IS110 family transposase [Acetobacteraceae bacterium]
MTTVHPTASNDEPAWFVGFDWGSEKHRIALFDRAGNLIGRRDVAHSAAAYAELGDWLLRTTQASPAEIAVAIETTHGPVVDALIDRGFRVYAINPKQLDRFRDRYSVAGAKDDTRDADTLGRSLRTDPEAFRALSPDNPLIVQLREASRTAAELTRDLGRLTNQLRDLLWRYYPQMLALDDNLAAPWLLELWQHAPTPAKGARLHKETIARILKTHRIRRLDADQVRTVLREPPLPSAPGVTEAATGHIRLLLPRIRLLNSQIKAVHTEIDALCQQLAGPQTIDPGGEPGESVPGQSIEQRDVAILHSVPGVGRIVGATLLAEASEPLRRRDYHAIRTLAGQAPVTKRSGKSCFVQRRLACNKRLANAMYHWARVAVMCDPRSKQRYAALRARGCSHGRTLRSVADRLLKLLCSLLQRQVSFDPNHNAKQAAAG